MDKSPFDAVELRKLIAEYEAYLGNGRRWSHARALGYRSRFAAFGLTDTAIADELLAQAKSLLNTTDWDRMAHHFADRLVDLWHAGDTPSGTLAEWMGLTEVQYAAWVETRYADVFRV